MTTRLIAAGNIGSAPEFREFPNDNEEPRRLLRLNVYFDNPVPQRDGTFKDRGGYWAAVEWWHRDAESWSRLFQKGMRVLVDGRTVCDRWEDEEGPRTAFKIEAQHVAMLPYRLASVTMAPRPADDEQPSDDATA